MTKAIYLEIEFWVLVVFSACVPATILLFLILKRRISRLTVAVTGSALILSAGLDAIILQRLGTMAKATPQLADDLVFASEFSIALFILPLIMAGIGVNLLSHLLHEHLIIAELEYERKKDDPPVSG